MLERQFVLEPDSDYPLYITAKMFWNTDLEANWDDPDAYTFIFLHSTSFHKETWEPTFRYLFESEHVQRRHSASLDRSAQVSRPPKIKYAWVIECPNHGESATLNTHALQVPPFFRDFGCEKYAEAAHRFMHLAPTRLQPVPFDFSREKLVGVGHSLGGVGISILPTLEPLFRFHALILIEPLLSPEGMDKLEHLRAHLIRAAYERRDKWPSRQSASHYFRKKTRWDPAILDNYVKHGLRTCEDNTGHASKNEDAVVTLACSREEEATMYRDETGPLRGIESLNELSATTAVGVIFGDKNDYIPRDVQDALVNPNSGRRIRTVRRIKGVGHLIPQHTPAELSRVLLDVWHRLVVPDDGVLPSKL